MNFRGVPPSAIFRAIARLHEGSRQACDKALANQAEAFRRRHRYPVIARRG